MNTTDVINHIDEYHEKIKANHGDWHDKSLEKEFLANEAKRTDDLKWALCRSLKGLRIFLTATKDREIMRGNRGFIRTPKQVFLLESMVAFGHPLTTHEIESILSRIPAEYITMKAAPWLIEGEYRSWEMLLNTQYGDSLLRRLKRAERWGLVDRLTDGKKNYYMVNDKGQAWVRNSTL